jgi:AraC-like DNA-binding protein
MNIRSSECCDFDPPFDPVAEILRDFRLSNTFYWRSELRAPWGLELVRECGAGFRFVVEGSCWLRWGDNPPLRLEAGDLVLLPHGRDHILADALDSPTVPVEELAREPLGTMAMLLRHGGSGALTVLIGGSVRFEEPGLHPLLEAMPEVLHLSCAGEVQDGMLRSMVAAMGAEALSTRPGGATVMTRLADILVIQAVRWWLDHGSAECSGWLRALRDPQVGRALALIHRRPEEHWTVRSLAQAVHLSRSVFSARFTELVGTPPMHYCTRWRMHLAGRWLQEDRLGIRAVAARLGYESEPSFSRAFKRHHGMPPGALRREALEPELAE